eukprot:m.127456 g.127456  ORF g.127456 m.127456 type:complete len:89 (+) comp9724_c0_seq3:188-454(+)
MPGAGAFGFGRPARRGEGLLGPDAVPDDLAGGGAGIFRRGDGLVFCPAGGFGSVLRRGETAAAGAASGVGGDADKSSGFCLSSVTVVN